MKKQQKKNKLTLRFLLCFFVSFSLLFSNLAPAVSGLSFASTNKNLVNVNPIDNTVASSELKSITSSQLGWAGPLSFHYSYDDLTGSSVGASYSQKLGEAFALALLADYGEFSYRLGATLGVKFSSSSLFKVSSERLSQKLPFDFDTGRVKERVWQNAYGARYQHVFDRGFLRGIDIGAYHAKAPNKWLDPIMFENGNSIFINYRHLAGATSQGIDIGSDLRLTPTASLASHLYYDKVKYNTYYGPSSDDANGLGVSLNITKLLTQNIKLDVAGSLRKIYNTYSLGIAKLFPITSKVTMEMSLTGQRTMSHNATPNSNSVLLGFGLNLDGKNQIYNLPSTIGSSDLGNFVKKPAVHMDRVLVVAEQSVKGLTSIEIVPMNPTIAVKDQTVVNAVLNAKGGGSRLHNKSGENAVDLLGKLQFSAIGRFADGATRDVTKMVTWRSSNDEVAVISNHQTSSGLAKAFGFGETEITATYGALVSGVSLLRVTTLQLDRIEITPKNASISETGKQQFTATGFYTDGSVSDLTELVRWVSSDSSVATISNDHGSAGLATGAHEGDTNITAILGAVVSQVADLKVTRPPELTSIVVTPTNPTILKGNSVQFTATGFYSDSSSQDITTAVVWDSSSPGVATISNAMSSKGLAVGVLEGASNIVASLGAITSAPQIITVKGPTVDLVSITVSPVSAEINVGETQKFIAEGTYSDSSKQDITNLATWSSSDTQVATIDTIGSDRGFALGKGIGEAGIIASLGSVTSPAASLVVKEATKLVSIKIIPSEESIFTGETFNFTAEGTYSDGTKSDITTLVVWESSDTTIATITSGDDGGKAMAADAKSGITTIKATLAEKSDAATLRVNPKLIGIYITPGSAQTIKVRDNLQFQVYGRYSDNIDRLVTADTWVSSRVDVATIDSNGLAKAISASSALSTEIKARFSGFESNPVNLNVIKKLVGITLGNVVSCIHFETGEKICDVVSPPVQLVSQERLPEGLDDHYATFSIANGSYDYGNGDIRNESLTETVTWLSSDPAILSINPSSGVARASSRLGEVDITAKAEGVVSGSIKAQSEAST